MKNLFALAACAALFTGCDFISGEDNGPPVTVSGIRLTNVPVDGFDTDGTTNDLVVEIQDALGRSYFRSEEVPNVTSDTLEISESFELSNSGRGLWIVLLDEDGAGSRPQTVAATQAFSSEELSESDSSVVTLGSYDASMNLQAEIQLDR